MYAKNKPHVLRAMQICGAISKHTHALICVASLITCVSRPVHLPPACRHRLATVACTSPVQFHDGLQLGGAWVLTRADGNTRYNTRVTRGFTRLFLRFRGRAPLVRIGHPAELLTHCTLPYNVRTDPRRALAPRPHRATRPRVAEATTIAATKISVAGATPLPPEATATELCSTL